MVDIYKQALKTFQCEQNRRAEEEFARIFTENDDIRLAFINENQAFTDGRNIVVDPAEDELYADADTLLQTADYLKLPHTVALPYNALKIITRSQNIHESLHIIYTEFPPRYLKDKRCSDIVRCKALGSISNIIEDAYIEAVGASIYDNVELYMKWGRVARFFTSAPSEGTLTRNFKKAGIDLRKVQLFMLVLNRLAFELLYPMFRLSPPEDDTAVYIERVRSLFFEGSAAPSPAQRHEYVCRIFDELEELLPESEEQFDMSFIDDLLGGTETHSGKQHGLKRIYSSGGEQVVTRRLFTDLDGNFLPHSDISAEARELVMLSEAEFAKLSAEEKKEVVLIHFGCHYDASPMHSHIRIEEKHPVADLKLQRAYKNLVDKNRLTISTYNSRFASLLKGEGDITENKKLFGAGISSRDLGDTKKRYWYTKHTDETVPELAVLFLVDGSGSMLGERRGAAMTSLLVLHEVLTKQEIQHAIVEQRAIYDEPLVQHNVLVDFGAGANEKLNIMRLSAYEGTREGLSLYWAERYLSSHTQADHKLIVVISDGVPAHYCDGDAYYPPVSVQDTKNAAQRISRRGTDIVAVALGGSEGSCYSELSEIYSEVIDCTELSSLTGQLLKLVTRLLAR